MRLILIFTLLMTLFSHAQNPVERRAKAADLEKNGNWKEAKEARVALLNEVVDEKSGEDLEILKGSLARLNEWSEFDGIVKKALEKQEENFYFLISASTSYANSPHYGGVLDGEFQRGRQQNRGEWRNVIEQDRIIALNLAHQAWQKAGDDKGQLVTAYGTFLDALLQGRTSSNESWQLAELTNFSEWPDLNEDRSRSGGSGGAAVTADGTPIYFDLPESWEKAATDGERWRWLRSEIGKLDKEQGAYQDIRWWNFSVSQFGVGTLAQFSWWQQQQQDPEKQKGILQVETLKEDETIANLATGVSRFTLREDYRFIAGYRELMKSGKGGYHEQAGDQLVGIFLNRRQFVAAEETLREVIDLHGAGSNDQRKERLKQIVAAWGQFENTSTFFAENEVKVPYLSRNAGAVKLTLRRIDAEKVMEDTFKYLEKNPREIDYLKTRLSLIGQRLLEKNLPRYLGEELKAWEAPLEKLPGHQDSLNELNLGKLEPGTYWLKADLPDGNHGWTVLWVRDLVLMKRSEKEGIVFYLAEAKNGQAVQGELEFFGFRTQQREKNNLLRNFDVITEHFRVKTDENGRYVLPQDKAKGSMNQYAIARAGKRVAFLDQHRWYWNENREDTYQMQKSFGMSDLPLYRPGQKVRLKFWAAEARYDLGDERKYANKDCAIEVRDGQGNVILEKKELRTDDKAAVSLEFDLPDDAGLGAYQVILRGEVPNTQMSFRVEEYKKPEYEVSIDAPEKPVTLGEKFEATVKATYYHGAPVTEAEVKVTVMRTEFTDFWFPPAPWDWLYGPGYWWFSPTYEWMPGWRSWGCVRPAPPWWGGGRGNPPELVLEKTYPIGIEGTVKVEIDSSLAQMVHGDQDHRYEITAEVVDASRRTIVGKGSVLAAREPFKVTTWLDQGYAKVGDKVTGHFEARSLDGKKVEGKAEAILFRVMTDENGKISEKEVKKWAVEGESWTFSASEAGQFRVAVRFTDEKGRMIEGASVFVVRGEAAAGEGKDFVFNDLELIPDKKEYHPGDTVKLLVNVNRPGSRVWLFVRPNQGAKEETRMFIIEGKSQVIEIPLDLGDMPNIFVEGMVVSEGEIHSVTREIVLPPEKRQLLVEVEPAKERLKPREKTKLTIRLRDSDGKPYQGEAVLTVYDKSMEYISGGSNVPDIQKFFWDWKRRYYGRGMESSQNFYGQNLLRQKDARMQILGIFGGQQYENGAGFGAMAGGAFGLDESVGRSKMSRSRNAASAPMMMEAMADGVAEDKAMSPEAEAAPEVVVRSDFADLLKFVGNISTDEKGEAVIELEMPDNLTTWKIKTWAMGTGTKVGEGSAEIITSKDLIVRLQAPRFFIDKDEVTLSAIVHNYHKDAKEVAISLEMDGGLLTTADPASSTVAIPAGGETRVDWTAKVSGEGEATIRMKAITNDDADAMEMKFPVYIHGMPRTESYSRAISAEQNSAVIPFTIPAERRPGESLLIVRYSPSVAVAMVEALPYLARYPYGCTEQTLNRFVPTVVTRDLLKSMNLDLAVIKNQKLKLNPQELPGGKGEELRQKENPNWNPVWDEAEVAKMERAGIKKLREQQNRDGGWGWFSAYGENSYPHTTAVVLHGLILAKNHGTNVPGDMIERGLNWLAQYENQEVEKIANWEIRKKNTKPKADAIDALVRRVLGEGGKENGKMREFLFRDKVDLPIYAKCLLGLELHRNGKNAERDEVLRNIEQFLKTDDENQTAWLDLGNSGYWWNWYGSNFEAQAWYLKLISAVKPKSKEASGLAKYLINNRRHATYWDSTRDTAYCLEALGDYLRASGESAPDLEVEVLLDGKVLKTVKITKENMFTFDGTVTVAGDILTSGDHKIELRKKGTGPLYANAYVTVFTLEDFIKKAGLEVKVERRFYKLVPEVTADSVPGARGQALKQQGQKYKRVELAVGDSVASGDLIEIELSVESKNDYEYLIFEDWKAAGLEPVEVRSGYNPNGLGAYMELRDEKVSLFVQKLPQGRHNLSYRLRAEIPGKFSALPTRAEAMYAPELKANSDEMKIQVTEKK